MARSIQQWFDEYGESHKNPTNKAIHWVCVPVIYFCVVGLLYSIPMPSDGPSWLVRGAVAYAVLVGIIIFYMKLSLPMGAGMGLFTLLCIRVAAGLDTHAPWPLWSICAALFVLAWIGQFYGHKVEGRKPSFLKDLQFLMIGPAWLMGFIYKRLGIAY